MPCEIKDGTIIPCKGLDAILELESGKGGVQVMQLSDFESGKFTRALVVAKSGSHRKRGLAFNFCPYCGHAILEQTPKAGDDR